EPTAAATARAGFRERDQAIEQRPRIGRGARGIEDGREPALGDRTKVGHRHDAHDRSAGVLGDVDVARERGERAPVETFAPLAVARQEGPDAREVAAPAAPYTHVVTGIHLGRPEIHLGSRRNVSVECLEVGATGVPRPAKPARHARYVRTVDASAVLDLLRAGRNSNAPVV